MNVFLLEQSMLDVPMQDGWLSESDLACLHSMRIEKRRTDWRLGRWTAKRAIAAYLGLPEYTQNLAKIEIRPAASGAPAAFYGGKPANAVISLSHRAGNALCAIAEAGAALGCDIEIVEPRSSAFVADYFTSEEHQLVSNAKPEDRAQLVALFWSAKESVLKTLGIGLRLDTRRLTVEPWSTAAPFGNSGEAAPSSIFQPSHGDEWHRFKVLFGANQIFQGWWQQSHARLRTVVSVPPPSQPIALAPRVPKARDADDVA